MMWVTKLLLVMGVVAAKQDDGGNNYEELGPALEVVAELGHRAFLPCSLSSPQPGDRPRLVLWFREEKPAKPIYTVDLRDRTLSNARHWSDEAALQGRGFFKMDQSPGVLVVEGVKAKDRGVYRCRVDFKIQPTTISRVDLAVNMPPEKPVILDSRGREVGRRLGPYRLGQTLVVSCSVLGGRPSPSVTWWRESQVVDTSYQREESRVTNMLTIPDLTRNHLHTILTCQASNSNVSLPVSTSVKLDLTFPPTEVVIKGADLPLSAGKSHSINCKANGARPSPKINWYLGKKQINGLQTQLHTSDEGTVSTIAITPTRQLAGQELRCVARVPGLGTEDMREEKTALKVNYIGKPSVNLPKSRVTQGEDVRMTCNIEAHPPPHSVTWLKDNLPVSVSGSRVIVSNLTLLLKSVNRHETGNYSCKASNSEGSETSKSQTLTVLFPPVCEDQPRTVRVALHQQVTVSCKVEAAPSSALSFRWVFKGKKGEEVDIPVAQMRISGPSSVVDYVPRTPQDYGTLLCWAENGVGRMKSPCRVELRPTSPPSPPHNCSLGPGPTLSCKAGEDGGRPQTFHLEAANEKGIVMANFSSSKPTFSLSSLDPGFKITISASNSEGNTAGPTLEIGGGDDGPAHALPSLNTQGLRVTPLLGALIGIGGALGILTFVLLLILLCRGKRSTPSTTRTFKMAEAEKDFQAPDLIPPSQCCEDEWPCEQRKDNNVFIVDPVYQCSGCPPYSTLQTVRRPCLPPAHYSSLRRHDYASSRCPPVLPEEIALLPPPPSLSSGLGSSGSDLDNSRTASDDCGGHSPRLLSDTAV